jgi:hypothetical protein
MNRKHSPTLAAIVAVMVAATGAVAVVDTAASAAPGEVNSGGMHLTASVDSNNVVSAGGDTPAGIPFSHSVKVSGDYSVHLDGAPLLRSGQIAVGYLVGCAVDLTNGISVGISPSVGASASISPFASITVGVDVMPDMMGMGVMPSVMPSVTLGLQPNFGVNGDLAGVFAVTLTPGTVRAAVIGTADLDEFATFPYTFGHTNTPLNVSACPVPATATPFVTVRADATNGTAQTTGYGDGFTF